MCVRERESECMIVSFKEEQKISRCAKVLSFISQGFHGNLQFLVLGTGSLAQLFHIFFLLAIFCLFNNIIKSSACISSPASGEECILKYKFIWQPMKISLLDNL